jgi:hypothetical protein
MVAMGSLNVGKGEALDVEGVEAINLFVCCHGTDI